MNKFKKAIAGLLCFAVIIGIAGCSSDNSQAPVQSSATTTTEDDELINPVDVDGVDLGLGEADISGTVINYLGCYDPTKAGDTKPAYVYFKETYNATLEVELSNDTEIMDKLTTYIASGDSPDLIDQRDNSFPYYISKNVYAPLDEYMDMDAPQWADVVTFIDNYEVNGQHYYYPWAYFVSPTFLIYNRGLFEEYGVDDPKELWDNNEWTWDTFNSCITDFVDAAKLEVPDVIGIYGQINSSLINSTGTSMISYKDGALQNNMRSAEVERAQLFMENLKKEGMSKLLYGDYSNVAAEPVVYGYSAFQTVGDWKITDYSKLQATDENLDIFFVPFPRDPAADGYYYKMSTFAYLVPSGAADIEASCIFINCVRLSKTDPELFEKTKASIMKSKKYTEEQYEFWAYFQNVGNFDPEYLVHDFSYSLDANTTADYIVHMLEDVAFISDEVDSWTTMRETYYNAVDDAVNSLNSFLQ